MHLGIYYKTKDGKKISHPIQAESHDELGGWLRYADTYIENHIKSSIPEANIINGIMLTKEEAKAIKPNYAQADDYGTFDYYEDMAYLNTFSQFTMKRIKMTLI